MWWVVVCDQETSWMWRSWHTGGYVAPKTYKPTSKYLKYEGAYNFVGKIKISFSCTLDETRRCLIWFNLIFHLIHVQVSNPRAHLQEDSSNKYRGSIIYVYMCSTAMFIRVWFLQRKEQEDGKIKINRDAFLFSTLYDWYIYRRLDNGFRVSPPSANCFIPHRSLWCGVSLRV